MGGNLKFKIVKLKEMFFVFFKVFFNVFFCSLLLLFFILFIYNFKVTPQFLPSKTCPICSLFIYFFLIILSLIFLIVIPLYNKYSKKKPPKFFFNLLRKVFVFIQHIYFFINKISIFNYIFSKIGIFLYNNKKHYLGIIFFCFLLPRGICSIILIIEILYYNKIYYFYYACLLLLIGMIFHLFLIFITEKISNSNFRKYIFENKINQKDVLLLKVNVPEEILHLSKLYFFSNLYYNSLQTKFINFKRVVLILFLIGWSFALYYSIINFPSI